jgi:hypothetical protein
MHGNLIPAIGILLLLPCVLPAQATITGRIEERRGERLAPIRHCTVYASSLDNGPLVGEFPDSQGNFLLDFAPDGRVRVGTICLGYRVVAVNGRDLSTLTYDCSQSGRCADVRLTLEPLAVVEGHVVDQNGMPVEDIRLELTHVGGGRPSRRHNKVSDDRGYFRFFHLPPGAYELRPYARPVVGRGLTWEADSQEIVLGPGDVESGVQVAMRPVELIELTGRIEGLPPDTGQVRLELREIPGGSRSRRTVEVDAEGRFRWPGLPGGKYQVRMNRRTQTGELEASRESYLGSVELGMEGGERIFAAREPTRLTGTIEVEWSERDPRHRDGVSFQLVGEDGYEERFHAYSPDYKFDVAGLAPGRYSLKVSGAGPKMSRRNRSGEWEPLDEITLKEGTTTEVDLWFRFDLGSLNVFVRPASSSDDAQRDRPAAHYVVVIRGHDRLRIYPTDQNGRLELRYFTRGDYEICAWRDISRRQAEDPATWEEAGDAVRRFRHDEGVDMEIMLTAAP